MRSSILLNFTVTNLTILKIAASTKLYHRFGNGTNQSQDKAVPVFWHWTFNCNGATYYTPRTMSSFVT